MMISSDDPRLLTIQLRRELIAAGYDDAAIARAIRIRDLTRPRRGAYVNADAFAKLDDLGQHAVRARAAARQANTEVVLSHASALSLYPDPVDWGLDLADVHLTRKDGKTGRREAGIRQHRGRIAEGDVITIGDVEVMAPARALLEITTISTVEVGLVHANHLLHGGLVTKKELRERYRSMDHWPETLATDLVLMLADGRIESVGESRTFHAIYRERLPLPIPQLVLVDERGREVARLDFAWPQYGVWLEFDGRIKYQKLLREGESVTDVVLREKKRQEMIEDLTGWRCIRVTWDDLRYPERLAAKIRAAFAARAA